MQALIAVVAMSMAADDHFPVVSPDGSRIAFLSERDGTEDLYVMASDGSHVLRLTRTPEVESQPSWAADGKAIRFSVWGKDSSRIYAVDAEGGNVNEIGKVQGRSVAISADGKRDLHALGTWTAVQLIESDLDGSHPRQLSDGSSVVWSPRWSPDGKTIAFTGRDGRGILHIYLMDADGSNVRQLTHFDPADGQAQCPAWSPDGRQLAVQANTKGSAHVWVVDAKSGAARKLAPHSQAFLDELPSWFPDGKRIAFQSNRSGRMAIWAMSVDGSGLQQLSGRADQNAALDAVQTAPDAATSQEVRR
jgi:TolB protein